MRRALLCISACLALAPPLPAAPGTIQPFTPDGRYSPTDPARAKSPSFDVRPWQAVTLPRNWAIAGPVSGDASTVSDKTMNIHR